MFPHCPHETPVTVLGTRLSSFPPRRGWCGDSGPHRSRGPGQPPRLLPGLGKGQWRRPARGLSGRGCSGSKQPAANPLSFLHRWISYRTTRAASRPPSVPPLCHLCTPREDPRKSPAAAESWAGRRLPGGGQSREPAPLRRERLTFCAEEEGEAREKKAPEMSAADEGRWKI